MVENAAFTSLPEPALYPNFSIPLPMAFLLCYTTGKNYAGVVH
ncbi:hypothetical protein [Microcoleus sp. FACHB-672]|nr:hypothetical protein [Microcoleus sp. FACHB-672]